MKRPERDCRNKLQKKMMKRTTMTNMMRKTKMDKVRMVVLAKEVAMRMKMRRKTTKRRQLNQPTRDKNECTMPYRVYPVQICYMLHIKMLYI